MHRDALIADYGPSFRGAAVRAGEGIVCVVPSRFRDSPDVRASMRDLVRDLGSECGRCPGCPLGRQG